MGKMILRTIAAISIFAVGGCGLLFPKYDEDYSGNFSADTPVSGAGGTVTLQENMTTGDIVYVDVYVDGVTDMLGASLKLSYDPVIAAWGGSYETGHLLERGGAPNYLVSEGNAGELIIGVSLTASDTPVVAGSEVLITVPLRIVGAGETAVNFFSSMLTDSGSSEITGVSYNGGSLAGIKNKDRDNSIF